MRFTVFAIIAISVNFTNVIYAEDTSEHGVELVYTDKTDTVISLAWNYKQSEGTEIYYNIYKNGELLEENLTTNSYSATGLSEKTEYTFKVAILDANNNVLGETNVLSVTTAELLMNITYDEDNKAVLTNDMYMVSSDLTIPEGKTLIIEAGTTLKLARYINVYGNLLLNGNQEEPIILTGKAGTSGSKLTLLGTSITSGALGKAANQLIATGTIDTNEVVISGITTLVGTATFGVGGKVTESGIKWILSYARKRSLNWRSNRYSISTANQR